MYKRNETEAIMQRIGRVRRSTGLSQAEFARALDVPLWQTVIAEHGAIFCADQDRTLIVKQLFDGNEFMMLLRKISRRYGVSMDWLRHGTGDVRLREMRMPEDELLVYFPVVISSQSLLTDMKGLLDLLRIDDFAEPERIAIEMDSLYPLFLKYKAYRSCLIQMGKPEIACAAGKKILDFCSQR